MGNPAIDFPSAKIQLTTEDVLVQTGACVLHNIVVNGTTTVGDVVVFDGIDNTGTSIATLTLRSAVQVSIQPITLSYDCEMSNGIFLEVTAFVGSLTITHK